MPERFPAAAALLREAIAAGAFPAAAVEVGRADEALWRDATGRLTYDQRVQPVDRDTIFDLASLTKVIATTTLVMRAVDEGRLSLDDPVSQWLRDWKGADRADVTIRDLLAHASGLTAYLPFFRDYTGRAEFEHAICSLPLEYPPRSQSIYSDLGFMLLGFILEDARHRGRRSVVLRRRSIRRDGSRRSFTGWHRSSRRSRCGSTRRAVGGAARPRPNSTTGGDACWWAKSTTRTPGRSAARPGMRDCSARPRQWAHSLARRCARSPASRPGQPGHDARVHHADRRPGQLARARLGHDAAHLVLRHAPFPDVDRPYRLHRHVAVDRLGARPLRRVPDQPRAPDAGERGDPAVPAAAPRRDRSTEL